MRSSTLDWVWAGQVAKVIEEALVKPGDAIELTLRSRRG